MASLVFGESVDYSLVKIHRGGYWLFFGFQDENTAVTPNGEMYFPGENFKEDYSSVDVGEQSWFIHEMVHVWQYQLGYPIKWIRAPRPNMSYSYVLGPDKRLCDFNMEAQGKILADYFLVAFRDSQRFMRNGKYRKTVDILPQLEAVLIDFLKNPKGEGNLPKTTE